MNFFKKITAIIVQTINRMNRISYPTLLVLVTSFLLHGMEPSNKIIVPSLHAQHDEIEFLLESQPASFSLDEKDCITQYTFRELIEKQARKRVPFIFCRVVTHSDDYRIFCHNMSSDILKHIYGPGFPNEIRPSEQTPLNPINRCPFDNAIDILLVNFNPENQKFDVQKLGTDLLAIRGNKRLINIINLANNTLPHEIGSKQYGNVAIELSQDHNRCIARHGDLMMAQHCIVKAEQKRGDKNEDLLRDACMRLLDVAKNKQDNYFTAHHAMYLVHIMMHDRKYKQFITSNGWIQKGAQSFLQDIVHQHHDLLARDRALLEQARMIEDSDPEMSEMLYKKVKESATSPTKKANAQVKLIKWDTHKNIDEKIKEIEETLAISKKHLESPDAHRRLAAQRTITIAEPLLTALQVEKRFQENQSTTPQPKKPAQRKLF